MDSSRRRFLAAAAAAIALPQVVLAAASTPGKERGLWLRRSGTGEECRLVYSRDGKLLLRPYRDVCHVMRDVKAQKIGVIDPDLLDVLYLTQKWFSAQGVRQPLIINSGFRTEKTNASIEGAARASLHTQGSAADIWIPGVTPDQITQLGLFFKAGGIGYYPKQGFVHLDTGLFRTWAK